ncbi:MAG: hypothetical protein JJE04_21615 [Acidobacteriia bacterium]|nr:hypothetical protein [Terriglobia bacterium]
MIWMFLPMFTAVGSALLAFYIMQAKLEVAIAKEREALIEAKAILNSHEQQTEAKMKAVEETTRRRSMDDFLADFRVEERHYMRENKSLFLNRKSMVLQERLYFRTLPLSNWVEHELTLEEGGDIQSLARACSIFSTKGFGEQAALSGISQSSTGVKFLE